MQVAPEISIRHEDVDATAEVLGNLNIEDDVNPTLPNGTAFALARANSRQRANTLSPKASPKQPRSSFSYDSGSPGMTINKAVPSPLSGAFPDPSTGNLSPEPSLSRKGTISSGAEEIRLPSRLSLFQFDDALSFAYFRKTDYNPRKERQVLYALHLRKLQDNNSPTSEKSKEKKRRSNPLSKLNSYLRPKKKKRTTGGLMHILNMSIHDRRSLHAVQYIHELTPQQLKKASPILKSKIFLYSAANRLEPVVQLLLDKGFLPNVNAPVFGDTSSRSFYFPSFFMVAISFEMDGIIRSMIKAKADVNAEWYGMSPLMIAASKGNIGLVSLLLESGANANQRVKLEDFMLLRSLKRWHHPKRADDSLDNSIVKAGKETSGVSVFAAPQQQNGNRSVPDYSEDYMKKKEVFAFELAGVCGHEDTAKLLLSKVDPKQLSNSQISLLVQFDVEFSAYLIKKGVRLDQMDACGAHPIHLAARAGKLEQVIGLVQSGVSVNLPGENSWTALHEAIVHYRKDVAQHLISLGADPTLKNKDGLTATDLARRIGLNEAEMNTYLGKSLDPDTFKKNVENVSSMIRVAQNNPETKLFAGLTMASSGLGGSSGSTNSIRKGSFKASVPEKKKNRTSLMGSSASTTTSSGSVTTPQISEPEPETSEAPRKSSKIRLFGRVSKG